MKNLSFIALISLATTVLSCGNKGANAPVTPATPKDLVVTPAAAASMASARIAFVDIDSLQDKYAWFKEQKAIFEGREKSLSASLESKARGLQGEMQALQQKAQQGTTPPAQLQKEEQALVQKQQSIAGERDRKGQELIKESQLFQAELMKKINTALAQIQKEKGFDYVMKHSKEPGSPLLFVNEQFDITNEVVAALNVKK